MLIQTKIMNFGSATLLLLLVNARLSLTQEAMTVCPVNVQEFILRNTTLLPPLTNIQATSEDALNNPATGFIETTSPPWCTDEGEGATQGHHVELTFTEQIVVEFLQSSGLLQSFVSNFSIQYSPSVTGNDFKTYGVLETHQSFIIEDILSSPGYFSLERPIVARRLRLVVNSGTTDIFGRLCWEIEMFGCSLNRARQIQDTSQGTNTPRTTSTTTEGPMAPASQSLPSNTPASSSCPPTPGVLTPSEKQQEILIIVLPAALATIVIILLIAIVSILICVCVTRRSPAKVGKSNQDQSVNSESLHYDSPRPVAYDVPRASIRSRGGSFASSNDTLHTPLSMEIKNPMYIAKPSLPVNSLQYTSFGNQVTSSSTNDYEMISDNVSSMDNRLYELQRSNSQPTRPRPDLPTVARTVDQSSSGYYSMIPGGGLMVPTVTEPDNQTSVQMDTTGEGATQSSTMAHGYAKVHKPTPTDSQGRVGADPPPAATTSIPTADNIHQTTL